MHERTIVPAAPPASPKVQLMIIPLSHPIPEQTDHPQAGANIRSEFCYDAVKN